ncbi:DUF6090 family protein [Christiangramia portivictoriae]|uniref:DUF6090 family protein n=1 Tax=Christiangramia portivictoriae TaxID=326069 RepID=UPI0003F4FD69|nr:DUF6090 family protein [Christiangramia portivictoriae]
MINFFRKIRQKLLEENRFKKYIIYALGEIVLVVLGILIALQINNWNQNRLNAIHENKILKNLKKELARNNELNEALVINRLDKKIESLKLAKKFCENELTVKDTLAFLNTVSYGGVFSGGHIFGERNSYDELINTGNIQLINNDSIKNSIANYYGYLNAVKDRAKVHSSRFSSYTSELRPFDTENPNYISKFDQFEMLQSFNSPEFRKLVDLELSYAFKVRDYIKNVRTQGDQTINLIEKKLKNEL